VYAPPFGKLSVTVGVDFHHALAALQANAGVAAMQAGPILKSYHLLPNGLLMSFPVLRERPA
jgi:hypothetical protein